MKRMLAISVTVATILLSVGWSTNFVSAAKLNNFTITNYDLEMKLGRDDDGRSTLEMTETITANFPQSNVNRGIERAIPTTYDNHSTSLKITSVQDGSGNKRQYSTYSSNDNTVVRIGDPDAYVSGEQVYVIRYTQRDVTRHFNDTGKDEFYWDTNGTQWKVPIDKLNVRLTVDESLRSTLTGDNACYQGAQGATNRCQLDSQGGTFATTTRGLTAGENVTLAIGFEPNTFAAYERSLFEKAIIVWAIVQFVTFIAAVALAIWLVARFLRIVNRSRELDPISPEYIPPSNASVTTSSHITKRATGSVMTAQLIDLAVRHYVKLYEVKGKSLLSAAEYEIEIVKDLSDLREEEQELLKDMFDKLPAVGERLNFKKLKNNTKYFMRTTDNDKKLTELIRGEYAFIEHDGATKKWLRKTALVLLIIGFVTLSIPLLIIAAVALGLSFMSYRLTDKGLNLRRYLEGLKLYIGVAETERLKMLQSPEGAEKVTRAVGGTDETSLVKLYERVLPYAVLFDQEKEWSKSLGTYYEQTGAQPDWYAGQGAFNAVFFASAISNISQAASQTSSFANSSSSSSGGSGGGGFSGGGGGGGGGGGW